METTESKTICTLLTGVIFLLLIQVAEGCVRLMHVCITYSYIIAVSNLSKTHIVLQHCIVII